MRKKLKKVRNNITYLIYNAVYNVDGLTIQNKLMFYYSLMFQIAIRLFIIKKLIQAHGKYIAWRDSAVSINKWQLIFYNFKYGNRLHKTLYKLLRLFADNEFNSSLSWSLLYKTSGSLWSDKRLSMDI